MLTSNFHKSKSKLNLTFNFHKSKSKLNLNLNETECVNILFSSINQ